MRLLLLPLLLLCLDLQAQTSVTLDRQEGALSRVFELVLESEQRRPLPAPDFRVLEQDFTILNNHKVSVSNFRSGTNYYNSRWTLRLRPKHTGQLKIPGIRVGAERSRSLIYTVVEHAEEEPESTIQVVTSIEPDLGYARSAMMLSVKLYFNQALTRAELTEPELDGVLIERLGPQRNFGEVRDGIDYQVIEQRYALFPMTPGRYELPPIEFIGANEFEPLVAHSEGVRFEAVSPPKLGSSQWLSATELHLSESWQPDNLDNLRVGDTVIRTLTIEAHNAPARWLPTPAIDPLENASVYPQAPQLSQSVDTGTLVSRKTVQYKLLLTKAGEVPFAAIELPWWDIVRDQPERSRLPATAISVGSFNAGPTVKTEENRVEPVPQSDSDANDTAGEQSSSANWMSWLWALIALICAAGWSISRAKLQQLKQQQIQQQQVEKIQEYGLKQRDYLLEETNAFNRLSRACSINDCQQVAEYLVQWAKFSWPHETIGDLTDVEIVADDPTLTYLLRDLEHHLYQPQADDDPWQGDLILNQITRLRKRNKSAGIQA
ncbi:MAG: BatD family protein [Motiliproteus sp.]|nr:BatD family protein [Motiliproteus sp.]MCW9051155.1 BatD family protein [Motiliproteus sp.]